MGISERKKREREERRGLIMRYAQELILERGTDEVRMQDIAERSELSKATVYLYFASKEELFQEICDKLSLNFCQYFASTIRKDLSALESVKYFWSCYVKMFGSNNDLLVIFSMRKYLMPQLSFAEINASGHEQSPTHLIYLSLCEMFTRGMQEGSFDLKLDAGHLARTVITLFSYAVEDAVRMDDVVRAKYIAETMRSTFTIFLRGIANKKH
ncbi:MAG: hypothetical protein Ta2A_06890 [Treponemataceae bacterium]|nr:MAG: hypothetical protein Ta2A_06890 [Treponemataceae bacterium]